MIYNIYIYIYICMATGMFLCRLYNGIPPACVVPRSWCLCSRPFRWTPLFQGCRHWDLGSARAFMAFMVRSGGSK